ncbi:hypothetical protein [Rosistilla oblonga]|uniref:TubC N-terminal docking domain-containing protein n=1 Tax=Rosistilla oblonga TaxID=2527990 RepID=A0A518IVT3_9BACT|nr:hypothetical protein [Rosistilla oblonga]QDV57202.1 hypothetical protein Mal33_32050 [Rosistilla oblonga]
MTTETLLADLSTRGVVITVAGDSIELDAPAGVLTDDDVVVLREHKSRVLDSLRSRCRPHNNPENYIKVPDDQRRGWVRSTCKLCGCFIGYRDTNCYTFKRNG